MTNKIRNYDKYDGNDEYNVKIKMQKQKIKKNQVENNWIQGMVREFCIPKYRRKTRKIKFNHSPDKREGLTTLKTSGNKREG